MGDRRVLVAEDDADLRRLLRHILVSWGYEPVLVEDGMAAMDVLGRPDGPSRAILDWMMPRLEGIEVVRRVRAQTRGRDLQILLLTARDRPEDVVAALEAGADDYISKPFDFAELHARLRKGPRRVAPDDGAAPVAHDVGSVLGGRWRLERSIAKGGMGQVWSAVHVDIGNRVAVKTIRSERATSAILRARFEAEAKAASRLKSPYVAQVFDYGVGADGSPFLVMELLEGISLSASVKRKGPMELGHLGTMITQISRALGHAHQHGLVHRDVKPDNVYLEDLGDDAALGTPFRAKLIDFGIARFVTGGGRRMTGEGSFVGTPGYSSPEQFLGEEVGPASDLWSLGAVAYFAATGTAPLRATEDASFATATLDEPFPVPSRVRPDLPRAFDGWVARACARHVADRFSSAAEMSKALRAVLGDVRAQPRIGAPDSPETGEVVVPSKRPSRSAAAPRRAGASATPESISTVVTSSPRTRRPARASTPGRRRP